MNAGRTALLRVLDPEILVLATVGDRRSDWVRAGQALQRVLLTATAKGLATTPISQPVEVPAVRRLLIDARSGLTVQMVLRIGHGKTLGRTPRRPLTDVLLPQRSASRAGAGGRDAIRSSRRPYKRYAIYI